MDKRKVGMFYPTYDLYVCLHKCNIESEQLHFLNMQVLFRKIGPVTCQIKHALRICRCPGTRGVLLLSYKRVISNWYQSYVK